jgi:hypothetical protein
MLIALNAPSKAWVCGRSLAGTEVRIQSGAWMIVSFEYCLLSGRGLHNRLMAVLPSVVCSISVIAKPRNKRPWPGVE